MLGIYVRSRTTAPGPFQAWCPFTARAGGEPYVTVGSVDDTLVGLLLGRARRAWQDRLEPRDRAALVHLSEDRLAL